MGTITVSTDTKTTVTGVSVGVTITVTLDIGSEGGQLELELDESFERTCELPSEGSWVAILSEGLGTGGGKGSMVIDCEKPGGINVRGQTTSEGSALRVMTPVGE